MKIIMTLAVVFGLILGGCGMANEQGANSTDEKSKMPVTKAFQDEYTRYFMKSTKETEEGFYTYESKTGGYSMLFPVNANLDEMFYERVKESFERINFGENTEDNFTYFVRLFYENKPSMTDLELNLSVLSDEQKYKGTYKETRGKDTLIKYATRILKASEKDNAYITFGFIHSEKNKEKGISMVYVASCPNEKQKCEIDQVKEENKAIKLMKSIEFTK
ncbi:hypothetical protein ACFQPF_17905 [Fictibacillus iocasae]|uniref:Lipoprotein n=1 Tax=Fictibacillus iocasae TaxID=2715437 RepID=A0ABW2NUK1_9BACL